MKCAVKVTFKIFVDSVVSLCLLYEGFDSIQIQDHKSMADKTFDFFEKKEKKTNPCYFGKRK
jgi:hypothetical protein